MVANLTRYLADPFSAEITALKLPDDMWELYQEFAQTMVGDEPDHRLMGIPSLVQNPMEKQVALVSAGIFAGDGKAYSDPQYESIRRTSVEWTLLLQIASDDENNVMWGDSGSLYVWIRKTDLATKRFDRCWVILQSY
ncbi:MAG: YwqG family protein [Ahrensia sp.]|nr:YwqG family protein [Ahrensia sp.]